MQLVLTLDYYIHFETLLEKLRAHNYVSFGTVTCVDRDRSCLDDIILRC